MALGRWVTHPHSGTAHYTVFGRMSECGQGAIPRTVKWKAGTDGALRVCKACCAALQRRVDSKGRPWVEQPRWIRLFQRPWDEICVDWL